MSKNNGSKSPATYFAAIVIERRHYSPAFVEEVKKLFRQWGWSYYKSEIETLRDGTSRTRLVFSREG